MTVRKILVVDDDAPIRRMLQRTLEAEGHEVGLADSGSSALDALATSPPDLMILDVAMPDMSGITVCEKIRSAGMNLPILFLTVRDSVADRVAGLDAGAQDYLTKPFATAELLARTRALLRRNDDSPGSTIGFGELVLDLRTRYATRGGRLIALSARESALLELLIRNARHVVTRELALETVWEGEARTENAVDRYVSYLRHKLGEPSMIRTIRGVGFILGQ